MILAIHIVTDSNQHFLLQGETVVNQEFARYLGGATLIQDAKLFNTAKVCFGSCGIIHGYVLEVEPLYYLRRTKRKYSYEEVANLLDTLDVSGLDGIRDTFNDPSIISVMLNPYSKNAGGAIVTVMEITDQLSFNAQQSVQETGAVDNSLLFVILELVVRAMTSQWVRTVDKAIFGGALWYAVCGFITTQALGMVKVRDEIQINIPSRIFGNPDDEGSLSGYPDVPYNVVDMELCVPLERTTDALNVIEGLLRDDPIAVLIVTLRFVKKSSSTLGLAKFDTTTTVEMTSFQDEDLWRLTYDWFERLFAEFETADIPHSYHWGKRFPLNNRWVPNTYGDDLTEWEEQRRILLGENEAMFRNDVMDQLGIW